MSLPKRRETSQAGFSVVCDECGLVFYVSHEIIGGSDSKKRCCRYTLSDTKISCAIINFVSKTTTFI